MRSKNIAIFGIVSICIGIIIGLIIATNFDWTQNSLAIEEKIENSSSPVSSEPLDYMSFNKAFVEIAKRVTPTVVSITSEKIVKVHNPFSDFFRDDPFFRRFFQVPRDGEREYRQDSLGSGVIVDKRGYIVTNYHVIKDADEINVVLNKKEYKAEIVGTDPETDLAVIKIDKKDLPAAQLGDSDKLEVGEWVLAIGSPFDIIFEHTVTAGIISAKGRSDLNLQGQITYQDFIQTDAAINPGNSGGALVNLRGQLIGINTAIIAGNRGGNIGIGFAIPINMVKRVMDQLIAYGKVMRGWLGVYIQKVDADLAESLGLKEAKGALVSDVMEDSPADKAGIKRSDVIIAVDDKEIEDDQTLINLIGLYAPGTKVKIKVIRNGRIKIIPVILGERNTKVGTLSSKGTNIWDRFGFEVENLTRSLAKKYGYEKEEGVVVVDIKTGSVAAEKFQIGDLIKEVDRKKVKNVFDLESILGKTKKGQIILFRVNRQGRNIFIALKAPK